jgi:hypothetical protein
MDRENPLKRPLQNLIRQQRRIKLLLNCLNLYLINQANLKKKLFRKIKPLKYFNKKPWAMVD